MGSPNGCSPPHALSQGLSLNLEVTAALGWWVNPGDLSASAFSVLRPRLIPPGLAFYYVYSLVLILVGQALYPLSHLTHSPHLARSPKACLMTEVSDKRLRGTGLRQIVWKALGNFLDDEETDTLYLFIFLCCSAGD